MRRVLSRLAFVVALVTGAGAHAQSQTPIRLIFPYAPGGPGDAMARLLAAKMQASLGRTVVVDNRTGGAGRVGVLAVKNAPADGSTLLFTPFAVMTIFPFVYRSLDYDPFADFAPVSQLVTFDFGMAVGPTVPARTAQELAAWLRANPDKAQFGSPAAGALPHFFGLQFGKAVGVELTHIAYRGAPPALADLVAGQIPMVVSPVSDQHELHKAGKVRMVATSGAERSIDAPEVPTFKEGGFDIVGQGWYGLFAPAGTPAETVTRVHKVVADAIAQPEVRDKLIGFGYRPTMTSPAALAAIQKADAARWEPVVKNSGFVAD